MCQTKVFAGYDFEFGSYVQSDQDLLQKDVTNNMLSIPNAEIKCSCKMNSNPTCLTSLYPVRILVWNSSLLPVEFTWTEQNIIYGSSCAIIVF